MKCLFNDALKPAAYMPNFTLAARSRAQFTMNSWKTGCGMEKALGQPANSCPGRRLAGHRGQQRGLSGALCPPRCPERCLGTAGPCWLLHPLTNTRGEELRSLAAGFALLQGRGAVPQLPAQIAGLAGKSPVSSLLRGFVMGTLICCWD